MSRNYFYHQPGKVGKVFVIAFYLYTNVGVHIVDMVHVNFLYIVS